MSPADVSHGGEAAVMCRAATSLRRCVQGDVSRTDQLAMCRSDVPALMCRAPTVGSDVSRRGESAAMCPR